MVECCLSREGLVGSGLRVGRAVGRLGGVVDLVGELGGTPLLPDGLACFGVVGRRRIPALLLQALDGGLVPVHLLGVEHDLHRVAGIGLGRGLEELLVGRLGVVDLEIELLDGLVGVLEERLRADAVAGGVVLLGDVSGTLRPTQENGSPPGEHRDEDDGQDDPHDPASAGAIDVSVGHVGKTAIVVELHG